MFKFYPNKPLMITTLLMILLGSCTAKTAFQCRVACAKCVDLEMHCNRSTKGNVDKAVLDKKPPLAEVIM